MKKIISLILTAVLILSLTACGGEANPEQVITRAATEPVTETAAPETEAAEAPFGFEAEGVLLVPGEAFDAGLLPEAESIYEVPSCAFEGNDKVYSYGTFEVTTGVDGTGECIRSIYLLDPNLTTPEGLALGDDVQTVREKLGSDCEEDGTALIYHRGSTDLYLILQGDTVAGIEYRVK